MALDELDGGRIFVRPGTSDIDNAIDYLSLGIYLPAPEVADRGMKRAAEFGSNIGAALTGLAHSFPNVDLLGVEPDPDNVRIARANVERFGERVVLVESAVWSEACDLVIEIEEGNEHGIVVRPSHDADPPGISVIPARPIDDLLSERWPNGDPVDYIHVTIEGSEPVVFDAPGDWPKRVGSLRVEVHPYFGYGQAECIAQLEKLGYRAWAAESPPGKWVFAVRD